MKQILIIGGGASGMMAAITAAKKNPNAQITVLERKDLTGRKILSTGNGRCNYTNEYMDISCFRSDDIKTAERILHSFDAEDTLEFFRGLGIIPKSRGGYIYPRSDQAQAIQEVLDAEAKRLGVHICTRVHVVSVKPAKKGFRIEADETILKEISGKNQQKKSKNKSNSSKQKSSKAETELIHRTYQADAVILAAGGKAASVLGSDGSGYSIAKAMGHSIVPVVPALVQLLVKNHPFEKASGVRTDAKVTAIVNGKKMAEDTGELQITAYGISGIPVFQISRFIAKALYHKEKAEVSVDFLPDMEEDEAVNFLTSRLKQMPERTAEDYLTSVFNKKLIPRLLELADIRFQAKAGTLQAEEIKRLAKVLKHTELTIADTNGFDNAQVCAGGVPLTEIDADTMESKCTDGFYLTGEVLDVDGICGGYNLQWAWATGYLAGCHAI